MPKQLLELEKLWQTPKIEGDRCIFMTQKDFAAQYTKIRLVKEIVFQCLTDPDKWRVVYPVGTEFYTMEAGNAFTSLAKNAGEPYMREPTHLTSKLGAILCASPDEYEIVTNGA